MFPIASILIPSGGSSFLNIPQNYTHLQLRITARSDYDRGAGNLVPVSLYAQFNDDGGANYSNHWLTGDGASATSSGGANNNGAHFGTYGLPGFRAPANVYGSFIIDILDYTNTNKYKTVKSLAGVDENGGGNASLVSSNWRSTAAITKIYLYADGNLVSGSRADLYGLQTSSVTGA